ncbi:MAG: UDP-N-acetylmuramoyl-L-alanine--D-glutamate ligase [Helicobacteraceae bacterium]|nr:UDP-N-acetylmuramoyl-L-alanine--D-glutamate ligase [Helicobacteraceae bacterium]
MKRALTFFGYGKTTKAMAKKYGASNFYDDSITSYFQDKDGNHIYPASEFISENSTCEIPSPGIAPNNPLILRAKNLISEYDFYVDQMPYTIWISGTNGKTTTTQMMTDLLSDKGALSGGNIGTPLAELDEKAPIWILETSSFSLHYINKASPNIYVLLPITPDHISWHGGLEEYKQAKLKPLSTMKDKEIVILPNALLDTPTNAFKIGYNDAEDLAKYFDIDTTKLNYKGAFLLDAVIALAVDKILYDRTQYEKINNFKLDPHRQEKLNDEHGRVWVNDSKATNIDATLAALKSYDTYQNIYIILGGDDKGVELETLFHELVKLNVKIFTIGKNEIRLIELAKKYMIPFLECHTLHNAIEEIDKIHGTHTVAMLSPAAASLDQFNSYSDRGDQFKEAVKDLRKNL